MKCEKLERCPFYLEKMPIDSGIGALYRMNYCEKDKAKCARYKVSTTLGPEFVPIDLYPNMTDRAQQMIDENSQKAKTI